MKVNTLKAAKQSLQRHIHARTFPHDPYVPGHDAPLNQPVQVRVRDVVGTYVINFPVIRVGDGKWVNASTGTSLCAGLTIVGWRHRAW